MSDYDFLGRCTKCGRQCLTGGCLNPGCRQPFNVVDALERENEVAALRAEVARERTRAAALEAVAAAARALRKACVTHGEVQQRVSNIEVRALCDALDRLDAAGGASGAVAVPRERVIEAMAAAWTGTPPTLDWARERCVALLGGAEPEAYDRTRGDSTLDRRERDIRALAVAAALGRTPRT